MSSGPFSDVTILDLTSVISGPFATAILADQGARVIKVESMAGDTMRFGGAMRKGVSSFFMALNRNKESIAIDLQKQEGVDLILKLAEKADVCLQNYRPGVVDRLGIGYEQLKAVNPAIIYGSISGAGASGPYAERRFYDPVIQAYAGYANAQKVNEEPQLIKMMLCDKVTALTMSQALSAALYHRARTGEGRHVEVSMLESCLYFFWPDRMTSQTFAEELDFPVPDLNAIYRVLPTQDGFITFIVISVEEFRSLATALGRDEWLSDPRFESTQSFRLNYAEVFPDIAQDIATKSTDEIVRLFMDADVPFGVVLDEDSILQDPQVVSEGLIAIHHDTDIGEVRAANRSIRFSGMETGFQTLAPGLSAHRGKVLSDIGLSDDAVSQLVEQGVVG
ncbi:MAG: CoA transferase [Pseudomonadales bacterium]|nr:CoA transferase [Pseudomonadales bacterium]MBO6703719.1 CoA transferase [Pseudomonadales bacterium]MBO7004224.1 CoA transferase [Pseudomonadales bacterium]